MARTKSTSAPAAQSHPSRITRAELVAECRSFRAPGPRPQSSLALVHMQLAVVLDALLEDLDYRSQPESVPAFHARCLAAILGDIEDAERVTGESLQ